MTGPVGIALQTGAIAELLANALGLDAQLANAIGSAITFFVVAVAVYLLGRVTVVQVHRDGDDEKRDR